jgi:L-lactate permease
MSDVTQDRDTWRAVMNTVMTFRFHKMRGISWLAEELPAFLEGLCSMESYILTFCARVLLPDREISYSNVEFIYVCMKHSTVLHNYCSNKMH